MLTFNTWHITYLSSLSIWHYVTPRSNVQVWSGSACFYDNRQWGEWRQTVKIIDRSDAGHHEIQWRLSSDQIKHVLLSGEYDQCDRSQANGPGPRHNCTMGNEPHSMWFSAILILQAKLFVFLFVVMSTYMCWRCTAVKCCDSALNGMQGTISGRILSYKGCI